MMKLWSISSWTNFTYKMGPPHLLSWVSKGADVMEDFYGEMVQRMGRSHWFPCHVYQIQTAYICVFQRPVSWWCHMWRQCVGRARRWIRSRNSCYSPILCWRVSDDLSCLPVLTVWFCSLGLDKSVSTGWPHGCTWSAAGKNNWNGGNLWMFSVQLTVKVQHLAAYQDGVFGLQK